MIGIASGVTSSCDITNKLVSNQGSVIFDGTNDFVDASSVASDLSMTTGTVSLWARITTTSNNESFFNISDGTSGNDKFSIFYLTSSEKIRGNYKFGGTAVNVEYSISNSAIVAAGWFHVALTYDTSANSLILYYNGSAVATSTTSLTAIDTSSVTIDRVYLGINSNNPNTLHAGYIDEYAYFARVLTASEISDIHAAKGNFNYAEDLTLTGSSNALKQWLRFGDGSVGGVKDQTTGLVDMSNPTLGSDVVVNGTFDADSNWTKGSGWTISGGTANCTNESGSDSEFKTTSGISGIQNKYVLFTFDLVSITDGSVSVTLEGTGGQDLSDLDAPGSYSFIKKTTDATPKIIFIADSSAGGLSIDNVAIRVLNGNTGVCSGSSNLISQSNLPG